MTVPVSDDVYVGGDTGFRDYHRCNGRQLRELGERPNSSNDDHQ
ncbi:hypothetical protein OK016_00255 [Vibrio chagasii]|nr:hypothetical protein [Vibrio chagasii]